MIRIFHDHETLSQAAAEYIVSAGRQCVGKRGKFDLVVSGGTTPVACYKILADQYRRERRLWNHTNLYWADERCVPPDNHESNYHLTRTVLLDFIPIPSTQIHRIRGEHPDPRLAAEEYDALLPLSPDLLILGMGEDGHTASIFPDSPVITETKRRVMCVEAPVEPRIRITITPRVIANAVDVLVLVSGEKKAPALERVFSDTNNLAETPGQLARHALWFVDKAAAERITKHLIAEGG